VLVGLPVMEDDIVAGLVAVGAPLRPFLFLLLVPLVCLVCKTSLLSSFFSLVTSKDRIDLWVDDLSENRIIVRKLDLFFILSIITYANWTITRDS